MSARARSRVLDEGAVIRIVEPPLGNEQRPSVSRLRASSAVAGQRANPIAERGVRAVDWHYLTRTFGRLGRSNRSFIWDRTPAMVSPTSNTKE